MKATHDENLTGKNFILLTNSEIIWSLNILLYEAIAFVIAMSLLTIAIAIIIKVVII